MNNRQKPPTFQDQGEQYLREEALRAARATQAPGQTKEQTRLIAKGIEKGIAQYKQQQKEKARERDKARKRALKQARAAPAETSGVEDDSHAGQAEPSAARLALIAAGSVFLLASLAHALRWIMSWEVTVAGWAFPSAASIPVTLALAGLAAWMYRCTMQVR